MTRTASERTHARRLGAALGASAAPGAVYAAWWSGVGDAGWHVWLFCAVIAALLGALTWPVFIVDREGSERPGAGFAAAFGASVGLLAGMLVAAPIGGVFGMVSGTFGGAITALVWSFTGRRKAVVQGAASASAGALLSLGLVAWWLA